jgi:hypothetical protein
MGMYDDVICYYPLPVPELDGQEYPDLIPIDHSFQTKSLDSLMDEYVIYADGSITICDYDSVTIPDEEREAYKLKHNISFAPIFRRIEKPPKPFSYHGMMEIYTYIKKDDKSYWIEYTIKCTDGKVVSASLREFKITNL